VVKIRDVGNIAVVFVTIEKIDVMVFHRLFFALIKGEVVLFDQLEKLADLIRLGLSIFVLEVEWFGNARMLKDMMAATDARSSKPKVMGFEGVLLTQKLLTRSGSATIAQILTQSLTDIKLEQAFERHFPIGRNFL
jgi:hypothetical protein